MSTAEPTIEQLVDAALLDAMTKARPQLVEILRKLVGIGESNAAILGHCYESGATPETMRNISHCLAAIRAELTSQ